MLEELHVRDLALIEEAWIELGPGMTALTGETGAGKTVLLGALQLLLGDRADSGAVRGGQAEALVEGRFIHDGDEIVVKRRVTADGRSKCTLDGSMATVGSLAERVGPMVELHGQHEHQALLSAATHAGFLDRWGREAVEPRLEAYREARRAWKQAVAARDALAEAARAAAADADGLERLVADVSAVDPQPGEDERIEARLPALRNSERLAEAAGLAAQALRGEDGALDRVASAAAALARVAGIDPALDAVAARLEEVAALVDDTGSTAREYRDGVDHDPRALEQAMDRLSELRRVMRAYGPSLDDVVHRREEAERALASVAGDTHELDRARRAAQEAEEALRDAAESLGAARRQAAPAFMSALEAETAVLAMPGAGFEVSFGELEFEAWGPDGPDKVEFLYRPAPGQPFRQLTRIASGGELSRVMLALKGVLGAADRASVLVFDEVDAGIGGATATAVGERLAKLARAHQVIVVTHLAQVAAYADTQLVVRKSLESDGAFTTVVPVESEDRVGEIARMLSGSDTDASRQHARELLAASAGAVTAT